jgi:hypothetical protein
VALLRWLYAAFFIAMGLMVAGPLVLGIGAPPPQPNPQAQAFVDALTRSRFIDPILAACYLAGGGASLWTRTAPIGLALLSPAVAIIVLYHLTLSGLWPVGLALGAVHTALLWHFRARLACLWREPRITDSA